MSIFLINSKSGLLLGATSKNELKLTGPAFDVKSINSLKQQWKLKPITSDGSYMFINCHFGTCIALNTLTASAQTVRLSEFNAEDERQHWILSEHMICSKVSKNFMLDIYNEQYEVGTEILLFKNKGQENQKFVISHYPTLY